MNKYAEHQRLLQETILFTQQKFPKIRIFQRHVGLFYTANNTPIKINQPGMADAWGWLPLSEYTLIIEIEFKTGNAKQSKEQKAWQAFCHSMGVLYILCRDKEDVSKQIRARLNVTLN
jgi:hypothetical protein